LPKGEICAVPYTAHLNDLHNLLNVYDLAQFELLLEEEFDQLYEEGAKRRRMMVVSSARQDRHASGVHPHVRSSPRSHGAEKRCLVRPQR
jgi:hypothetical protein